ncbi:P-loop containing nucleoside triphosphate hydrolase protein [Mycena crocata]|nr:P-loop containing nucleoside triphosphate hydrolase protein [Mycena crocata]
MRLAACVPSISPDLVFSLEKSGIRTDADLLFSGSTLNIFRRLPAGTTTLRELVDATAFVAESSSASGQSASALLDAHTDFNDDFLSGVPKLDELLCGLTTSRRLIEVSGDKGSGKTSLLLHLVLRHLVHQRQSSVLWIDTTGDFSAARASEVLELLNDPCTPATLGRLQISLAFEVDAVLEVLENLALSLSSTTHHAVRLGGIVVDAVTSLLGPLLSPVSSEGHAIMTGFMRQLRAFAQTFSITIFVVNNSAAFTPFVIGSTSNNPNIRKPALGPSFTFLTDATLWLALSKDCSARHEADTREEWTKHVAQVYRSKLTTSRTLCSFKIQQGVLLASDDTDA